MILASALRASVSNGPFSSPMDDRWYQPGLGLASFGSVAISPESMFRCSTVLAALRFLATSVGLCRPQIIRYDGAARRPEPDHYAQRVLRRPHPRFTDFEWWELNVVWMSTWGNAYNRIDPSPESPVGRLTPLAPWRMSVVDSASDGGLIYRYTPKLGAPEILTEDRLLRFPGISIDGVEGAAMYQLMRNVVSIALLAERHTGSFLSKGARIGGVLVPDSPLDAEQREELVTTWNAAVGGPDKTGTIAALPFGMKFETFTQTHQEAQFIELDDRTVAHILRFLNVPGVVVGFADKTATYASAEAFFEKGGIKHSILPLCTRLERRIDHSLIYEPEVVCKMNLDALLRADTEKRFAALFRATGRPWMTGNEARSIEDMNPVDDPSMDEVAMPTNLTTQDLAADTTGSTRAPRQAQASSADRRLNWLYDHAWHAKGGDAEESARETQLERGRRLAILAASRVVRRELAAIKDRVTLAARDQVAWSAWVTDYYQRHAATVAREMDLRDDVAAAYATSQRDALIAGGIGITSSWEATAIPKLAALAFGD